MIQEDYIRFEIAKLLEEKGFDWECKTMKFYPEPDYDQESPDGIYAPTLQMAMKWLREVHKIHIQIWILEDNGYWFDIEKILNPQYKHKSLYSTGLEDIYFDSYEEACEEAIKYCLENLI